MKKYYRLIGIVILIIILTRVDLQKILVYFSRMNISFIILINLLIFPSLFIKSFRWRYLLRLQGINYPISDSFLSYLGGICAGAITPGRLGEAVKAIYLKEDIGTPLSQGLASVFIDRLFDLYILILLGSIGLLHFLNAEDIKYGVIIILAFFLFLIPFSLFNKALLEKISKFIYKSMISGFDKNLFSGQFKSFFSAVKKTIMQSIHIPIILTVLAYLIYFCQCYLLAHLASIDISFLTVVFFVSMANLFSLLPITILGIGTREASLVYLFSLAGLHAEGALVYSFLLFFSFYLVTGLMAFIGWIVKGRKRKIIKNY